jgi:transposase-like protein
MPWHCPVCRTSIWHSELEKRPRSGVGYRCPVCHRVLVVDVGTHRLTVAPSPDDAKRWEPTTK